MLSPVEPAAGGPEERSPTAAPGCAGSGATRRLPGGDRRPEGIPPVRPRGPGAEETLPGAAGELFHSQDPFYFKELKGVQAEQTSPKFLQFTAVYFRYCTATFIVFLVCFLF